ncbi:hypothetical protein PHYC_02675 [Phycisphaerales bacterium]|nr:hypothetical protein PHYC_02675 [Phycisphaerales bacterium]
MRDSLEHPFPRRRRWRRKVLIALLVVGVFIATWFLTRGYIVRRVVTGQLASLTGGEVSASKITLESGGTLIIENGVVRAPGVPGDGGEVFTVRRLEADVSWRSLLRGEPQIKRVVLDDPVARISQSVDDASVNLAALKPASQSGKPGVIPLMLVRGGVVELGEHRASGDYTVLRKIPVAGQVEHAPDQSGQMQIAFNELDATGAPVVGPRGLQLTGSVSKESVTLNLGVVSLATWSPDSMPRPIREAFRQLAMEGEVRGATLTYKFSGDVEAKAELRGVAVTLPVEVRPGEDPQGNPIPVAPADVGKRLRMQNVSGSVVLTSKGLAAEMAGLVENLPYQVSFRSQGSSADAPFTCTISCSDFHLAQKPEVFKFAPGIVRRRLEQFSDPTGTLDARVTLSREAGARPGDISVKGSLALRGTTAAFERFPYKFHNLHGEVEFDDSGVTIKRIEGDAPGGVKVSATGTIAPLTDEAEVHVDVVASGVPIDDTLMSAMAVRGRVVQEVFNRKRHGDLVAKGLISSGGKGAGPAFDLGGAIDVHAVVRRDPGPGVDNWHDTVTITVKEARAVPERVPYPIIARNVTIVKNDLTATVSGGTYTGLEGGAARITASADLSSLTDPDAPFIPDIEIAAEGMPLSRLLAAAVPEGASLGGRPIADALTGLNLAGRVNIKAKVTPRPDAATREDIATFRVEIEGDGISASPLAPDGSSRVVLTDAGVAVDVTDETVSLDVQAKVGAPGAVPTNVSLIASADRRSTSGDEPFTLTATLPAFETATPVEDLVRQAAPEAAAELDDARSRLAPQGLASLRVDVSRSANGPISAAVHATDLKKLTLKMSDGRLGLTSLGGEVVGQRAADGPSVLTFREFVAAAMFEGQENGTLRLNGACKADATSAGGPLQVEVTGGRFESPLVRSIVGTAAPARFAAFFKDSDLHGTFDLAARMTAKDGSPGGWDATGAIKPRSMAARFGDTEVEFPGVTGSIEFSPDGGRVKDLNLVAPSWNVLASGGWIRSEDGGTALQAAATLDAHSLTPDLEAVLPERVREVLQDLSGNIEGPIRVEPGAISITTGPQGEMRALRVSGRADVTRASLDAGVTIERADGVIDFSASRDSDQDPVVFDLLGMFDRFAANGLETSRARLRVAGAPDGSVLIPMFSAECHGGRVTGDAVVSAPGESAREYRATLQLSGVRFASVLADYAQREPGTVPGELTEAAPDESRGLLDASISIAGPIGDPKSRRGRGTATVAGGRVVNIPLLVPLVRISNLQLPINENVDYAAAEFFIQGEYLNFDSLSVFTRSVEVVGFGTVKWPGLDLDLRFRPKARTRIPMLTSVMEGIRNELLAVRAEGTLAQPELAINTLSGTSRFIGRLFGETPSEQQRRLDAIGERAREGPIKREEREPVGQQTP